MKSFIYLKKFINLPLLEKKLLLQGVLIATIYKILIRFVPPKYYLYYFKFATLKLSKDNNNLISLKINKTLRRMNKVLPWSKNCLVKALTYRYLLNKTGIKSNLVFSTRKDAKNKIIAHAYLLLENNVNYFKKPSFTDIYVI
jgi:hypothetical protein